MKETIYWKNFLIKVAQQTQKPLTSPIRFKLWPQIRKVISEVTSRIREQDRRSWFLVLLTWRKIKQIKRQWSVMVDLGFVWWCLQVSTVPVIRQGSWCILGRVRFYRSLLNRFVTPNAGVFPIPSNNPNFLLNPVRLVCTWNWIG